MSKVKCKKSKLIRAQSLFEVVFAIGVAALLLTGVVSLSSRSVSTTSSNKNNFYANAYAQEAMEWLRNERDTTGWDMFYTNSGTYNKQCLITLGWTTTTTCGDTDFITGTIFKRSLELTRPSTNQVTGAVDVSWQEGSGVKHVKATTTLTDWRAKTGYSPEATPTPTGGNQCPTVGLGPNAIGNGQNQPITVNFAGTATDPDPDGNIASYTLNFGDGSTVYGPISATTRTINFSTSHTYNNCNPSHPCWNRDGAAHNFCLCIASLTVMDNLGCSRSISSGVTFGNCATPGNSCSAKPCCNGYIYTCDPGTQRCVLAN